METTPARGAVDPVLMSRNVQGAIAIVGRPNVGKSALFNRMIGRRLAIVHGEPGVTRDRIAAEAHWAGRTFQIFDTGGLALIDRAQAPDEISAAIRQQVEAAIEDADAILMVTDVQSGCTPLDEDVARWLYECGRPVAIAANKADHAGLELAVAEFHRFGWPVFAVSAEHGRGIGELLDWVVERWPPAEKHHTDVTMPATAPRVVVLGRPNVGKSSFINRLLQRQRLVVSPVPGTTRDCVEVPLITDVGDGPRTYILVDTAGLRASKRLESAVERFSIARAERALKHADLAVVMIDASVGPTRQDQRIARMVADQHVGYMLVVNKWDLASMGLGPAARQRRAAEAVEDLRRQFPFLDDVPIHLISALTGAGMAGVIQSLSRVAANTTVRLTTGLLNRVLHDAFERKAPPTVRGRRLKLYYAVQTGVRPLRVRLYVNDPELLPPAYRSYLIHRLRSAWSLEGAPLVLDAEPRAGRKAGPSRTDSSGAAAPNAAAGPAGSGW